MPRPALTDATFYAHIFSPSKNPKPTGLRKRTLAGPKGSRKARVNAYNRMPAEKQAVVDKAGFRDRFLRGEATYTDARRALREQAVKAGIVKPVKPRRPKQPPTTLYNQALIQHLKDEGLDQRPLWNEDSTLRRYARLDRSEKRPVLQADRATIRRRATDSSYENEDGINPYWYH